MCEEAPAVIYCVGYILPIGCCAVGTCMSCYGCYRYYYASRMRRMQSNLANARQVILEQPKIKRDSLKSRITEQFLNLIGSKEDPTLEVELQDVSLNEVKDNCPICLMEYEKDTSQIFIGLIKGCGHHFHFECIWEWLERRQNCPICRDTCELTETDIRGLSLKQLMDFIHNEGGPNQTLSTEEEKHSPEHFAGTSVVCTHPEPSSSGTGWSQNEAPREKLGEENPAFQGEMAETNDVAGHDATSPDITRS